MENSKAKYTVEKDISSGEMVMTIDKVRFKYVIERVDFDVVIQPKPVDEVITKLNMFEVPFIQDNKIGIPALRYCFEGVYYIVFNADRLVFTNCSKMFTNCHAKSLLVKKVDTTQVKTVSGMFESAWVENLDLSWLDTKNVRSTRKMFYKSTIIDINLNGLDMRSCRDATSMFEEFTTVRGLSLDKVKNGKGNFDRQRIFYSCTSANVRGLSKLGLDSEKSIQRAFSGSTLVRVNNGVYMAQALPRYLDPPFGM